MKLLIIDDDEKIRYSLKRIIEEEEKELEIYMASNGEEGLEVFKTEKIDIVITDIVMGKINGIEVLERIKEQNSDAIVIMITGKGSETTVLEAIKKGAYDYFSKPFEYSVFFKTLRNAKEKILLKREIERIKNGNYKEILYVSTKMKALLEMIDRVAKSNLSVLITGESGTGKELIAESIYNSSERKRGPFIKINCGAIPENLMESELFGHVKGAFSGAVADKKGKLEAADKGVIFLDEVGELDMKLQVKLLRVLEDGIVERVGGVKGQKVDVRVIAATNVDLEKAVEEKKFRLDLFYRLNILKIDVPPLRERREDIEYLAKIFVSQYANQFDVGEKLLDDEVIGVFQNYDWPGNIRELKNTIQRMIVLTGDKRVIRLDDLPSNINGNKKESEQGDILDLSLKDYIFIQEEKYLKSALARYGDNKSEMAKKIGISRRGLYEKLSEHKIKE